RILGGGGDWGMLSGTHSAQQVPTLGTVTKDGRIKSRADRTRNLKGWSRSRLWSRLHRRRALIGKGSRAWPSVIRTVFSHTTRVLIREGQRASPAGTVVPAGMCVLPPHVIIACYDRRSYHEAKLRGIEQERVPCCVAGASPPVSAH